MAQCEPTVPNYFVDLTSSSDATWTSPLVVREGLCCGNTAPDKCIVFEVLLHPSSVGIKFEVCSGATPGGALFYQVACGPPNPVGEILCLSGSGPHIITFCKPGNNLNEYCITSVPKPSAGEDVSVLDGCNNILSSSGYDESTIVWTSVFPGTPGQYDGLLNCSAECASTIASGGTGLPSYFDYQVCGFPIAGCSSQMICDTVRVFNFSELQVYISPENPVICYGETSLQLEATGSGGVEPYIFSWDNGEFGSTIDVGVGIYIVQISDSTGCTFSSDTVTVDAITTSVEAIAGPDQSICESNLPVTLNGAVNGAPSAYWVGNGGDFSMSLYNLNNTYMPSLDEISNGEFEIMLVTEGQGTCDKDTSTMNVTLIDFQGNITGYIEDVKCFGGSDGSILIDVNGPAKPYEYLWDASTGNSTLNQISDLAFGIYSVNITDDNGCDTLLQLNVSQSQELLFENVMVTDPTCSDSNNGSIEIDLIGGTLPYSFNWSNNGTINNIYGLGSGIYTLEVSDSLGCILDTALNIQSPEPISVMASISAATCFGQNDGSVSLSVSGGTSAYEYFWSNSLGNSSSHNDLYEGSYSILVSDANNCSWDSMITINQPTQVQILNVLGDTICPGASGQISAIGNGGSGSLSFFWDQGLGLGQEHMVDPVGTTSYSVYAMDSLGCISIIDTALVFIKELVIKSLSINAIDTICLGEQTTIQAYHNQNYGNFIYTWDQFSDGLGPHIVSPEETTTYYLTILDNCQNTLKDSITIFVGKYPKIDLADTLASGCAPLHVNFSSSPFQSEYTFLWDFDDSNISTEPGPENTFEDPGIYNVSLSVLSSLGCESLSDGSHLVIVHKPMEIQLSANPANTNISDPDVFFEDLSGDGVSWFWDFGDETFSDLQSVLHTYSDTGHYQVNLLASTAFGCLDSTEILITIHPSADLIVPNAFTPNIFGESSGVYDVTNTSNDIFYPFTKYVEKYHMTIFNRWGEMIFETFDINIGWDGYYQGLPSPQDVYIYQIDIKWVDGKEENRTGDVTLFR